MKKPISPFFARFLEKQKPESNGLEIKSEIKGGRPATTLKYPSDRDEAVTMKYPSDGDEDIIRF